MNEPELLLHPLSQVLVHRPDGYQGSLQFVSPLLLMRNGGSENVYYKIHSDDLLLA